MAKSTARRRRRRRNGLLPATKLTSALAIAATVLIDLILVLGVGGILIQANFLNPVTVIVVVVVLFVVSYLVIEPIERWLRRPPRR